MAEADDPRPGTALVLLGHGSARNRSSSAPTRACGERIRGWKIFDQVEVAFWKEEPFLGVILDRIGAPEVYVVPNLAAKGYITGELIPRQMGLRGPVTLRREGLQRVYLCEPVGGHPRIAAFIADRAVSLMATHRLAPEDTCILLVGHGSGRNPQSAIQTKALADTLSALQIAAEVKAAFLEHEPRVADWTLQTDAGAVMVVPFMISNGHHGAEDVPALLGIDPASPKIRAMIADGIPAGPFHLRGRRLWYCRAVGSEPFIADLVLDQVAAFDRAHPAAVAKQSIR